MARPIDRKQLKAPDRFVTFWTRVAGALATRLTAVIALVAGVFLVIVGTWGVQRFLSGRLVGASEAYARIERIASADLVPEKDAPKFDDGLPHFKTDKERTAAALKEAEAFLTRGDGARLRPEAMLLRARLLLAAGRTAEATAAYRELLGAGVPPKLRFLATDGLGHALEASGALDQAATAFDEAARDADQAGGFHRDQALFGKARVLAQKGRPKDAAKVYREILEKTPATPLRDEINDRLASLEDK